MKTNISNCFLPPDFDLIISDEAHRSISGNSRGIFEYFIGAKLGLTATPRDYLKNLDEKELAETDPRDYERRVLLQRIRHSDVRAASLHIVTPWKKESRMDI